MVTPIIYEHSNGISTITINRPERRNVIDYNGWLKLREILEGVSLDQTAKAVLLKGAGQEAFSAGADITDFDKHRSNSKQAQNYHEAFSGTLNAIENLPIPTVSLIKGFCVGGGCELALATDIRISADTGKFGIPAGKLGITIGYGEMRRLTQLLGPGNASYLLLSGQIVDADNAMQMGLVNQVIPVSEVDIFVNKLLKSISSMAPLSQRHHKTIMRRVLSNLDLDQLTPTDEHLPFKNFDSDDFSEGRRAFSEKRGPKFRGK